MKIFIKIAITIITFESFIFSAISQTQLSPKYSVDGKVRSSVSKGDTLILGGDFYHVGLYTGGGAFVNESSDKPYPNTPSLEQVDVSVSDGKGGVYISSKGVITHILSDFSYEPGFTFNLNGKVYSLAIQNGILLIGGEQIYPYYTKDTANLLGIDVTTKQFIRWLPKINARVSTVKVANSTVYIIGNFTEVASQARKGAAAFELMTGKIKIWNPSFGGGYTDLLSYKSKIIIGGSFGDSVFNNHGCVIVDSVSGRDSVAYIFNRSNLYWAAGVNKLAVKGDTLYTFTSGTYDTRLTCVNLSTNKIIWYKYVSPGAQANGLEVLGNFVYLGGWSFNQSYKANIPPSEAYILERAVKNVIRVDSRTGELSNWSPDPVGLIYDDVNCLSISGANIFIGGRFSHLKGVQRSGIAMIDVKQDLILPFFINLDYYSRNVNALKLIDSTLYLGGNFAAKDGLPFTTSVFSINVNNGNILPWQTGPIGNISIIEANKTNIYLGGQLSDPKGFGNRYITAVSRITGANLKWDPNPDSYVSAIYFANSRLYVGGAFSNIGGKQINNIAAFDSTLTLITSWAPKILAANSIISTDSTIWVGGTLLSPSLTGINAKTGEIIHTISADVSRVSDQINSLVVKNGILFGSGPTYAYSDQTGTYANVSNLLMLDTKRRQYIKNYFFHLDNPQQQVRSISFVNNDLYFGGDITAINGHISSLYLNRVRFQPNFFDSIANLSFYFYPKSAGNGGDVSLTLYGNFDIQNIKLKLTALGKPDIQVPDSNIYISREGNLTAKIDLRKKLIGDYNVIITDKNGIQIVATQKFTVEQFKRPDLFVLISGPNFIRTDNINRVVISVNNRGNSDVEGVPLFFYLSDNATAHFSSKIGTMAGDIKDTVMYTVVDGVPVVGRAKVYWLLIPRIKAGSSSYLRLEVKPDRVHEIVNMRVSINDPLFNSPLPPDKEACLVSVLSFAKDLVVSEVKSAAVGCVNDGVGVAKDLVKTVYYNEKMNDIEAADFGAHVGGAFVNCVQLIVPETKIIKGVYDGLKRVNDLTGAAASGAGIGDNCRNILDFLGEDDEQSAFTGNSIDPNEKVGVGLGEGHYITGEKSLQYGIMFENIKTASLPAQTVKITDTLDKSFLDLSTFKLNFINFGKNFIPASPGETKFDKNMDLRPSMNAILHVNAVFDTTSGILTVLFSTLDPNTMQPVTDPLTGFLPPNINIGEGNGSINYSVSLKTNLVHKMKISNRATIKFDGNPSILTASWSNIVDLAPPISSVNPLPSVTADSAFTISWNGYDTESGVSSYDLYYSVNNNPFVPLIVEASEKQIQFIGKPDSVYSFYVIARDSLGNQELKNIADTKTKVLKITEDIRVYPNPNSGIFFVLAKDNKKIDDLKVYDLYNHLVNAKIDIVGNGLQIKLNLPVAAGIYVVRAQIAGKQVLSKLFIASK